MRPGLFIAAPSLLLLCLACSPRPAGTIYSPWEEGLTLGYEDVSKPPSQRLPNRIQVRVARCVAKPGSPTLVQLDLTDLRSQASLLFRHQDGGTALVDEAGRVFAQPLPVGFPAVTRWVDRGIDYRVIGRAAWDGAALLPPGTDPVGIWVEARWPEGLRRRTLFLPNLGEVESREERDGAWVTVNRLVSRGFTDLPALKRPWR